MATQIESGTQACGAEKHIGDARTLDSYEYVCVLPAGHDGYHQGVVRGGTSRMGWPDRSSTKCSMVGTMPPRALEVSATLEASGQSAAQVITAVPCPYCHAGVGHHCTDPKTGRAARVHCRRVDLSRRRAG